MRKRNLTAVIIAILLLVGVFFFWRTADTPEEPSVNPETMGTIPPDFSPDGPKAPPPPPVDTAIPTGIAAGFLPTQMEDPQKFAAYQKHIQEMAACLNMEVQPLDPQAEINFENLNKVISPDLGEIVLENDEWFVTDIQTTGGEIRRIYVENVRDPNDQVQRNLKYYRMGTDGSQAEIPVAAEQAGNASETLIASLESDGKVIGRSNSRRIFYSNGDTILLVERDGKIFSFELPHDGKTFSCTGADSAVTMSCQCK